MTRNQIEYQRNVETQRSNIERERETGRSNRQTEQLRAAELAEATRAHRAAEEESKRSHIAQESLGYANLSLGYTQAAEAQRSHLAQELEQNRANVAREEETNRANLASEDIKKTQMTLDYGAKLLADRTVRRGQDMAQQTAGGTAAINFIGNLGNSIIRLVGRRNIK